MTNKASSSEKYPTNASSLSSGASGAASRTDASESPSVSRSWGDLSFQTARESHVESARAAHQVGLSDPRDLVLAVNSRVGHLCLCFRRPSEECAGGLRAFARYVVQLCVTLVVRSLAISVSSRNQTRHRERRVVVWSCDPDTCILPYFHRISIKKLHCASVSSYPQCPMTSLFVSLLSRQEKERVALELGAAFALLLVLADQCNVDLPLAVELKIELNAKKYPALLVR